MSRATRVPSAYAYQGLERFQSMTLLHCVYTIKICGNKMFMRGPKPSLVSCKVEDLTHRLEGSVRGLDLSEPVHVCHADVPSVDE